MVRKKVRKRSSFLTGLLLFINILLVLAMMAAYLSNHISPDKMWYFAFAGLAYPFIFLANLLMMAGWLPIRPKFALISLVTLLLGFQVASRHVRMNYPDEFTRDSTIVQVASFNAHFFDIWAKYGKPQYGTLDRVVSFFNHNQPDILCLQEGIISHKRTGKVAEKIRNDLGYKGMVANSYYRNGSSGMVIYHQGKLLEKGEIKHEDRTIAIYADLEINGKPLRVYSVHLQSIQLGRESYVMEHFSADAYKDTLFVKGSRLIVKKLKYAFMRRAQQADLLHDHIRQCGIPVVVCGDLNDTPCSYAYHRTRKGMKDAFVEAGKGMGRTYHGKFPSFRIDYIFASKGLTVKSFTTDKTRLSDHQPVFAHLQFTNAQP